MTAFCDSNVVLYLFGNDAKATIAEDLINTGAVISVQVLNEVASVLRRKRRMGWPDIRQIIGVVRATREIVSCDLVTTKTVGDLPSATISRSTTR